MKAILALGKGGPEVLQLGDAAEPILTHTHVLVKVHATALNRADLLQRRGLYPPPPGASEILGLEFAGVVSEAGEHAYGVRPGERVMGLLAGGGYAETAATHPRLLMPLPAGLSFEQGAAIPEAFLTANEVLFSLGRLAPGETVLIHAAAGGVGSAAVMLAHNAGARVIAVVSSAAKASFVLGLGANEVILREHESLKERLSALGGVDVVLDFVGKSCAAVHSEVLRPRGRWVVVGLLSGSTAAIDLKAVLSKRLELLGFVLRTQSLAEKIAITERFIREQLPLFGSGSLRPLIDSVFALEQASQAHARLEQNENLGKVVLRVR